ncbi:MAG TPA: hypothetical protein VEU77_00645 [Candidatus Acidoferrales bacterium]|nr:hypothetical protein [Candidatus Acidoferrales bacterium]
MHQREPRLRLALANAERAERRDVVRDRDLDRPLGAQDRGEIGLEGRREHVLEQEPRPERGMRRRQPARVDGGDVRGLAREER